MKAKNLMKAISASLLTASFVLPMAPAMAAPDVLNMDQLLKRVEQGRISEGKENRKREARFAKQKGEQERLLQEAKAQRAEEEKRSTALEARFEKNDKELGQAEELLRERMGSLTELFGHITTASGDLRSTLDASLTNTQFTGRQALLDDLIVKTSNTATLPSIEEIEGLWFELQREMIETGKVVKYKASYSRPGGERTEGDVVRVGVFNVVSAEGNYLTYTEENGLSELARQPSGSYLSMAEELAYAKTGLTKFGVDPTGPSGGTYLSALIETPTIAERWHQGGVVGYIITGVGVVAVLVAVWRLLVLTLVSTKVRSQLKNAEPKTNNPLGRVLKVHKDNPKADVETLELKLSEAVLKELPSLEYGQTLLKIIAGVAPLLGLLGTVTGMIITFQAIVIYGAGDPKAMAGGISSALITTVLGLCVAIPTVLLHTAVSGRSKRVIHVLEEQSVGLIAQQNEALGGEE